jgi:tetratricopeptide (TPR) repeat protein
VTGEGALLLKQGEQLNQIGRYADALPILRKASAVMPDAPQARCELALALMHLSAYREALNELDAAAVADPEYERQYRLRSILLGDMGRTDESLRAAQIAVRLAPQLPHALLTLGNAQLRAKRIRDAELTASILARLAPDWAPSHLLVGQVAIKRKKWSDAEAANRRALQMDPTQQAALNNLGVALQGQRRTQEAIEVYQRAAQLDPSDPVAKSNIVRLVRPTSGLGLALDVVRMIVIPWSIPIILARLSWQAVRSARRRRLLRPGARLYYDREWGTAERVVKRILVAVFVFIIGYAALAFAQVKGWRFVDTGVPALTLAVICLIIAASAWLASPAAGLLRRVRISLKR